MMAYKWDYPEKQTKCMIPKKDLREFYKRLEIDVAKEKDEDKRMKLIKIMTDVWTVINFY